MVLIRKEPEYSVSTKIFWKRNKHNMYLTEIFISTPCRIDYTFDNGMSIKGSLEIKRFSTSESNDSLGIFADFYYYNNQINNYLEHTEGFLIDFDLEFPIQKR